MAEEVIVVIPCRLEELAVHLNVHRYLCLGKKCQKSSWTTVKFWVTSEQVARECPMQLSDREKMKRSTLYVQIRANLCIFSPSM